MTVGIYGIFDSETDECLYVGMSSVSVEKRFKQHLKNLRNGNHPRKDFVEWFHNNSGQPELVVFRILEECENNETVLNTLEIKWFNELKPKYFGKQPSLNEVWERSEESKKKVSESLRKLHNSDFLDGQIDDILSFAKNTSMTVAEAARLLNVSPKKLKNYLILNKIDWAYSSDDPAENRKILHWYFNEKMSTRQIAKKLNISQPSVVRRLKKLKEADPEKFSGIKERHHRVPVQFTDKRSKKLSQSLKNLEKITCQYCSENFTPMNIKRHEKSCKDWPRCNCGKKLSKQTAKKCQECTSVKIKPVCEICRKGLKNKTAKLCRKHYYERNSNKT